MRRVWLIGTGQFGPSSAQLGLQMIARVDCPASKGEDIVSDASIGLLAQNVVAQTAPQSFAENYWVRLRRGSEGQNTQNILTP